MLFHCYSPDLELLSLKFLVKTDNCSLILQNVHFASTAKGGRYGSDQCTNPGETM